MPHCLAKYAGFVLRIERLPLVVVLIIEDAVPSLPRGRLRAFRVFGTLNDKCGSSGPRAVVPAFVALHGYLARARSKGPRIRVLAMLLFQPEYRRFIGFLLAHRAGNGQHQQQSKSGSGFPSAGA